MSKIALQANNSGTGIFTIASPNSDTNRTVTLPDLSGSAVLNEGSGIFKIDSAGNVGIGTTTPIADLDVVGYAATTRGITMGTANVDATAYLSQYRSTVETIWGPLTTRALFGTVSNHDVAVQTNDLERIRIAANGDVGIGTSSPAARLDVAGNIRDTIGDVRNLVNSIQTSAYVPTAADNGEMINITTGGVTINSGIFSAGNNITVYNNSATAQTITQGTSVTLRLAGSATTGNRTLAQRGICTIVCVASNEFVISGAGLT